MPQNILSKPFTLQFTALGTQPWFYSIIIAGIDMIYEVDNKR